MAIVNAAVNIADGDDFGAVFAPANSAVTEPTLPKPCTTAVHLAEVQADRVRRAVDQVGDAASGGFAPAQRAAEADGFAGDDARNGMADMHGIGVHHPRHRLFVRAHVRSHDVHLRADERNHFLRVTGG